MHRGPGERGNGRGDEEFETELERLVNEAVDALGPPPEPAMDVWLGGVAERLKAHPDRQALVDRLRNAVLAPTLAPDPPPGPEPSADGS